MRNGRNSCLFGEELVSYIYDELAAADRASFETHLVDCSECASAFAELSMSRLGVYEWRRDEFAPLETPRFAIPYEMPAFSWFGAVRAFLSPARLSFAAVGLVFAIAGSAFIYLGTIGGQTDVADLPASIEVAAPQPEIVESFEQEIEQPDAGEPERAKTETAENEMRPVTVKTVRKPHKVSSPKTMTTARRTETNPASVPRLGNYDEVEDTSLRLADLVADIDTYR